MGRRDNGDRDLGGVVMMVVRMGGRHHLDLMVGLGGRRLVTMVVVVVVGGRRSIVVTVVTGRDYCIVVILSVMAGIRGYN